MPKAKKVPGDDEDDLSSVPITHTHYWQAALGCIVTVTPDRATRLLEAGEMVWPMARARTALRSTREAGVNQT